MAFYVLFVIPAQAGIHDVGSDYAGLGLRTESSLTRSEPARILPAGRQPPWGHDMPQEFVIASFKDVADGLQEGQFSVGERRKATTLDDLDPIYRNLLDEPITVTMAVIGPDGRPG